jgi:predicted transcriptional regulator
MPRPPANPPLFELVYSRLIEHPATVDHLAIELDALEGDISRCIHCLQAEGMVEAGEMREVYDGRRRHEIYWRISDPPCRRLHTS